MPIPIPAIIALIDAAFKVADIIVKSKDIDPEDKKKLIEIIKEAKEIPKEWDAE